MWGSAKGQTPRSARDRRRDILTLDLPLAFGITLCTVLTIVEATRAIGGNPRSWAYTFEWPLIGAFICWIWYRYRISARRDRSEQPDEAGVQQTSTEATGGQRPGGSSQVSNGGLSKATSAPEAEAAPSAPGLSGVLASLTSRWRAQVAEAEAAYDRENQEALRAWQEYSDGVRRGDSPEERPARHGSDDRTR